MCVCSHPDPTATHHTHRKQFNGDWFNGKILNRSIDGLATDAKPRYHVHYEDDDEEELYAEEILPLLKVCSSLSPLSALLSLPILTYPPKSPPHSVYVTS